MHARITTGLAQDGKLEEVLEVVRESIVPVMKQQPGFKGYLALSDPATNKVVSITLWETEADVVAGETGGYYREQITKIAGLLASTPTREHFEVSIQI